MDEELQERLTQHWQEKYGRIIRESQKREVDGKSNTTGGNPPASGTSRGTR